ncbi:MAG: hypothetical protein LBG11_01780, partial [Bifidobacteriaceae bacterium]|nr:hypothetical protein [Bifidobacteriaceae bacterium]
GGWAANYREALIADFGPGGFQRYGGAGGSDAAVALAQPPLVTGLEEASAQAFTQAQVDLVRPAGGLAPGAKWRDGGISWTPETAMFAFAAAGLGDTASAERWLNWLNEHRTAAGALPEKVTAEGAPASVAPLAWTCSLVILALAELRSHQP